MLHGKLKTGRQGQRSSRETPLKVVENNWVINKYLTIDLILWLVRRPVARTGGGPPVHSVVQLALGPVATVSLQRVLADVQIRAPVAIPTAAAVVILAGLDPGV